MTKNHKSNFVEKTISTIIIIILFIIAIIILIKQSSYNINKYGMISSGTSSGNSDFDLAAISVETFQPDNYKLYLQKELYNKENLHEKINGKATLYLETGFIKMLSQRYSDTTNEKFWFEVFIYDMGAPKNAFSVYSQQKRADVESIKTMSMAYSTPNAIYISEGNYYIEILGALQSNKMNKAILQAGHKIEQFFKSSDDNISELSLFDKKLIVQGSENLYQNDAFGYHGWTNIYAAKYKSGDSKTTVFISKKTDEKTARDEAMGYIKFLLENGGTKVKTSVKDIVLVDLFGSYESIFTYKNFILGVHGADNQKISEDLSIDLIKSIKKVNP